MQSRRLSEIIETDIQPEEVESIDLSLPILTSMINAEAAGLFIERSFQVRMDIGLELEERIVVVVDEPLDDNWELTVTDIYDQSGRFRFRLKNDEPRLSMKLPMTGFNSGKAKCCLRIEIKPDNQEQKEYLMAIGKVLNEEAGSQIFAKHGRAITLTNGDQVLLNWDGADNYWVESDVDGESIISLLPPGIRGIGYDRSHVNVIGIDQYSYKDFLQMYLANLNATSRTAKGVIDTSASEQKAAAIDTNTDNLEDQVHKNAIKVCENIWLKHNNEITSPEEIKNLFEQIALQVGNGIEADPLAFRTWPVKYGFKLEPEDVGPAMDQFYADLFEKINLADQGLEDAGQIAAWIEWMIDSGIHPYADGCGRKAKAFSAFVLARFNKQLPVHTDRKEYYDAMNAGYDQFLEYYLAKLGKGIR